MLCLMYRSISRQCIITRIHWGRNDGHVDEGADYKECLPYCKLSFIIGKISGANLLESYEC